MQWAREELLEPLANFSELSRLPANHLPPPAPQLAAEPDDIPPPLQSPTGPTQPPPPKPPPKHTAHSQLPSKPQHSPPLPETKPPAQNPQPRGLPSKSTKASHSPPIRSDASILPLNIDAKAAPARPRLAKPSTVAFKSPNGDAVLPSAFKARQGGIKSAANV